MYHASIVIYTAVSFYHGNLPSYISTYLSSYKSFRSHTAKKLAVIMLYMQNVSMLAQLSIRRAFTESVLTYRYRIKSLIHTVCHII